MARRNKVVSATAGRSDIPAIESVLIDKRVLAGYRKRAKTAYPNEYLEIMFGKITGAEAEVHVMLPLSHFASRDACVYDPADIEVLKEDVQAQGLEFVGTVHSHPTSNTCSHPSDTDHKTGVDHHEPVMGVMWIRKVDGVMKSTVSFNVPRKPVKVKFSV